MEFVRENYTAEYMDEDIIKITAAHEGSHRIFWSALAEGFSDDNELESFEKTTIVESPLKKRRCYYHVVSQHGYSVVAARNLIQDGVSNLRDIGGYNTADMKSFVKHGVLFRSGLLHYKEKDKKQFVESLGLKQIIDFRMPEEATGKHADPVIPGADHINLSPLEKSKMRQFVKTLDELLELSGEQAINAYEDVMGAYKTMMFGSEAYQKMFRLILDGKLPLLYHCSAGKDRTGIATALILTALGVPRETIIYDYMLTNEVRADFIKRRVAEFAEKCGGDRLVLKAMGFFITVNVEAIESTFRAIDEKYSNVEDYFEKELLVTKSDTEKLKSMLLVSHNME